VEKKSILTTSQQAQVQAQVKKYLDLEAFVVDNKTNSSDKSFNFDDEQPQGDLDYDSQ
jgi:hypothetical protein